MGVSKWLALLWSSFVSWYHGYPKDPIDQAAKQRYDKSNKLQTAYEAVIVNSLEKLDKRERDVVEQYQNKVLFNSSDSPSATQKGSGKGKDEGEMLIADDIRINNIKHGGMAPVLVAAAMGALAWHFISGQSPENKDPVSEHSNKAEGGDQSSTSPDDVPGESQGDTFPSSAQSPEIRWRSRVHDYRVRARVVED